MTYRIALIGTGRVGYQFSFGDLPDNHAEAVAHVAGCQLVAGVNRGREKLEEFGRRFGVDALYCDFRLMLKEVAPDICIVATHPELHLDMVVGCAEAASTRAIICEKPMALSLEECDRMVAACERADVLLQINHNRRWDAEWQLAAQLLKEGAIGDLFHVRCHWDGGKPKPSWRSDNEGPLLHDFTHYFDMLDMLAGRVEWLCGMAEQRARPWAIEDFGAAFVKFSNGVTGTLYSAELSEYCDLDFELRGSRGVIQMKDERVKLLQPVLDDYEPESGFQWSSLAETEIARPQPASTYVCALEELLAALEGSGSLRSDGTVGSRSLEMITAVYQSQLAGSQPVTFPLQDRASGVEALRHEGQFRDRTS